eukprot:1131023-Amphidinium_carterae.1
MVKGNSLAAQYWVRTVTWFTRAPKPKCVRSGDGYLSGVIISMLPRTTMPCICIAMTRSLSWVRALIRECSNLSVPVRGGRILIADFVGTQHIQKARDCFQKLPLEGDPRAS